MPTQRPAHIDYTPNPAPRCTVRRLTTLLRQQCQPLRQLRAASGSRRGRAGLLSAVQAPQQKACRSIALHDTLHSLFAPSRLRSFAPAYLRFAPCVITAHRHRSAPRLDMNICVKGERSAVVCAKIRKLDFHAHGSDFTARSAYSARAKRGEGEKKRQGGGGSSQTVAGAKSPPAPPKSPIISDFKFSTQGEPKISLEMSVKKCLTDIPTISGIMLIFSIIILRRSPSKLSFNGSQ